MIIEDVATVTVQMSERFLCMVPYSDVQIFPIHYTTEGDEYGLQIIDVYSGEIAA